MNIAGANRYEESPISSVRITVDGLKGAGKTRFLATMPTPSLLFNFDGGFKGVLDKFADREIYIADLTEEYDYALSDVRNTKVNAMALKERFEGMIEDAISQGIRSIGVDGGAIVWDFYKLSFFGDEEPLPAAYAKPNFEFERLVRRFEYTDVNFCITHHLKEKWVGAKRKVEGEYVVAGYSRVELLVQACITLQKVVTEVDGVKSLHWEAVFRESRFNPELITMPPIRSESGMINFPNMAAMLTNTDVEVWQ